MLLELTDGPERHICLGDGAALLGGFAASAGAEILAAISAIATSSPFRHMISRGGSRMSVA